MFNPQKKRMKKLILHTSLFLIGMIVPFCSAFAQIDPLLESHFKTYAQFVTNNPKDKQVLDFQYQRIEKNVSSLQNSLKSKFPNDRFTDFQFSQTGGYGTHTPVRSVGDAPSSDLDINMLFKINGGVKTTISVYDFKQEVIGWLRKIFPDTVRYKIYMKEPVVTVVADTTFPDNTTLKYEIDLGSFNLLTTPDNPKCSSLKKCSQIAWGITRDTTVSKWNETEAPGFSEDFNRRFPVTNEVGALVLSATKMLKYWNKYTNMDATRPDNVPPSLTYLIAAYDFLPVPPPSSTLQQLRVMVDSLRKKVFVDSTCSDVSKARLDVPFYTSMDPNILRRMDPASLRKFCNSLKKMSDTLKYVAGLNPNNITRALEALSNVFPNFNNLAPGLYAVYSPNSSKIIYPKNGGANNDTIVQVTYSNVPEKKWRVINIEASSGKLYYPVYNEKSKKVWEVSGSSTVRGTSVVQGEFSNLSNQLWEIVFVGYLDNGNKKLYRIVNKKSSLYMEVKGQSVSDNALVVQENLTTLDNQKWYFTVVQ